MPEIIIKPKHTITFFEQKEVRRIWHNEQWFFSVTDVVQVLTDSVDVKQYIKKMRGRDIELSRNWGTICTLLQVVSKDGKKRQETLASIRGIFRIIQSISSPKAEPFKQWLAKVGQDRVEEIQDPEKAMARAKQIYDQKGYPEDWVAKRMRGIAIRNTLTDEWKNRGVTKEYGILTDEIYQATFGMSAKAYKKYKSLHPEHNLRDHMDDIELILTMLGEATTTKLTQDRNSQNIPKLQVDARDGGRVAGRTRKDIEQQTNAPVINKGNFLPKQKKLPRKHNIQIRNKKQKLP